MPDHDIASDQQQEPAAEPAEEPTAEPTAEATPHSRLAAVTTAVGSAVGTAGEAIHVAGHAVEAAGHAVEAVGRRWRESGQRIRRVRRLGRQPLRNLYDVHPEVRSANPRELGTRTIPVDEILGSAVAGQPQRGGDFLPLKPFRTANWAARWQRILQAIDTLTTLPPIDVVRYGDGYWVTDGHNRVAAALYGGQVEIDANITELIPPGGRSHEPPGPIASAVLESRALRTAASGAPPSGLVPFDEQTGGPSNHRHDRPEEEAPGS